MYELTATNNFFFYTCLSSGDACIYLTNRSQSLKCMIKSMRSMLFIENMASHGLVVKFRQSKMIKIDFDGIQQRVVALNLPKKSFQHLYPGVGGSIIYSENTEGSPLLNIHRFIFNTRKTDLLIGGISNISISQNRKQLLYQAGSTWGIIKSESPGKVGDGKLNHMGMWMGNDHNGM